jgi:hypothetical protein
MWGGLRLLLPWLNEGNSLVVSLLGFLEHLLGMHEIQLAGLLVILGECTLGPNWLLEIL